MPAEESKKVPVEVVVEATDAAGVTQAVAAAYAGGAARIELCAAMHLDGLTPPPALVRAAREAFGTRRGLLVMIRPRPGDFVYTPAEIASMRAAIWTAAEAGADGVVLGALRADDGTVARLEMARLLQEAAGMNLSTTFHRAFDATPDPDAALDALLDLGVERVLTTGIPWGQAGTALDGADRLARLLERAEDRLEVVAGGGVTPEIVRALRQRLPAHRGRFSVHAYRGAQENGQTTEAAVRALVAAAA